MALPPDDRVPARIADPLSPPPGSAPLDPAASGRLLERARRGDEEAFGELLDRHRAELLRSVRAWVGRSLARHTSAEDVVQEACLRAYRARARLRTDDPATFQAWLARIARNHLLDEAKKRRPEGPLGGGASADPFDRTGLAEPAGPATSSSPAGSAGYNEQKLVVLRTLCELRGEERLVLILRELLQLSWETTTLLLGRRSEKATRGLHARAWAKLARRLEPLLASG